MILIYFAPVPWDSYAQRPHYVVRHFLKRSGNRVVWIDPYPTRFPALKDFRLRPAAASQSDARPPGLSVVKVRVVPLEPLAAGRWLNRLLVWNRLAQDLDRRRQGARLVIGIGRPGSLALAALRAFDPEWSFYDAMDDFPEFHGGLARKAIATCEAAIADAVDAILTPSSAIWDKFALQPAKRVMLHNACEVSLLPPPASRSGPPVFGYVGCISTWFDWSSVVRLAEAQPDAQVQIVGPCFSPPPRTLPRNITLLPACSHAMAMAHLQRFSVGLIPFKRTRLTDGVDPIKYYEYRAMGLPVLTTTFGEMARRGIGDGTYFMDSERGIELEAEAALNQSTDSTSVARFRLEDTWDRRFEQARLFEHLPP